MQRKIKMLFIIPIFGILLCVILLLVITRNKSDKSTKNENTIIISKTPQLASATDVIKTPEVIVEKTEDGYAFILECGIPDAEINVTKEDENTYSLTLPEELSAHYEIYYRASCDHLGFLGWAKSGEKAGSDSAIYKINDFEAFVVNKDEVNIKSETPAYFIATDFAELEGDFKVEANILTNSVTIYKGEVPVKVMICSAGKTTPTGNFYIGEKFEWHYLIHNNYGQYCTRIDGPIMFHSVPYNKQDYYSLKTEEYNKLGELASAGCIRLTVADAKWINDYLPYGTPVLVYEDENPGPLGKPEPIKIPDNQTFDPTDPYVIEQSNADNSEN